jgi:hypothetical protein
LNEIVLGNAREVCRVMLMQRCLGYHGDRMSSLKSQRSWVPSPDRFPRLVFVLDFFFDLLCLATINLGLRLFLTFVSWMDHVLPAGNPSNLHSYLPVEHLRIIVTVVHSVSMLSIAISGICVLIKITRRQVKSVA